VDKFRDSMEGEDGMRTTVESVYAAADALAAWARYVDRAPMYTPGPADYSRPMGTVADHQDPDKALAMLVIDLLIEKRAYRVRDPRDPACFVRSPLRDLLLWVHRNAGDPRDFRPWSRRWEYPQHTEQELLTFDGTRVYGQFVAELEGRVRAFLEEQRARAPRVEICDQMVHPDP